jgi:thiamine monophosphate synthase
MARVGDPGAGAGTIEAVTQALAEKAWEIFRAIEAGGGLLAALRAGAFQRDIAAMRDRRAERFKAGEAAIVGATLNVPAHLARLGATRVDYVGVGPFRPTTSKAKLAPVHSADSLAALIAAAAPRPAFAIGGVAAADFPALRALGAYGIAVSGAIALAADPEAAARALVASVGA